MFASTIAPVTVSTAIAAFDRWAADRVLVQVAPPCTAPAVAEEADRYEPSVADEWNHVGFQLGADGLLLDVESVFATASSRDYLKGGFAFTEGQHAGYSRFARNAGFEAGVAGHGDALPRLIPSRFARSFELGHSEGIAERRARGECMNEYFAELAGEAMEAEHERELEHFARQCGGWDRLIGREME